jgi:putative endonuclease
LPVESDETADPATTAQLARTVDRRAEGTAVGVSADDAAVAGNPATGDAAQDPSSYYMYVVQCADGSLYTGYAVDVERRVAQHNAGRGAKYTRSRRPVRLVAAARFATQHEALAAEYRFKRIPRVRKVQLIERARALVEEDAGSEAGSHVGESAFARVLHGVFDLTERPAPPESSSDSSETGVVRGE